MFDAALRPMIDRILDPAGRRLADAGISANQATLAGFVCGIGAASAVLVGWTAAAVTLLLLNRFLDGLDGAIARAVGKTDLGGDMLALCAAMLVAGYMLCSKLARGQLSAIDAIFWLTVTEVCAGTVLTLASGERLFPTDAMDLAAPLFLALVVQVGGQGLIIFGLGRTPAAIAGVLVLVQPVTAAAISWQLFEEPLNTFQGFGALLILAGVMIAQRGGVDARSAAPPDAPENVTHTPIR